MSENSNQALVGTDAIKAFLESFKNLGDENLSRIVVEELLMCLLSKRIQ